MKISQAIITTVCLALTGITNAAPNAAPADKVGDVTMKADGSLFLFTRDLEGPERRCITCPCGGFDPDSCCCPQGWDCCGTDEECPDC